MAGSFGYDASTIDVSLKMGELSLLPAVRKAADDALIVADGTSCRHQIHDGADRSALHVARVLEDEYRGGELEPPSSRPASPSWNSRRSGLWPQIRSISTLSRGM